KPSKRTAPMPWQSDIELPDYRRWICDKVMPTLVPDTDLQDLKLSAPPPSSESDLTDQSSSESPSSPTSQVLDDTASWFEQSCNV
ncbi:hypothetical protein PS6_011899, partial [Mucor atramentarius]